MPPKSRKKAAGGSSQVRQQQPSEASTAQKVTSNPKKKKGRKSLPDWNAWELYALSLASVAGGRTPDQRVRGLAKEVAQLYKEKLTFLATNDPEFEWPDCVSFKGYTDEATGRVYPPGSWTLELSTSIRPVSVANLFKKWNTDVRKFSVHAYTAGLASWWSTYV